MCRSGPARGAENGGGSQGLTKQCLPPRSHHPAPTPSPPLAVPPASPASLASSQRPPAVPSFAHPILPKSAHSASRLLAKSVRRKRGMELVPAGPSSAPRLCPDCRVSDPSAALLLLLTQKAGVGGGEVAAPPGGLPGPRGVPRGCPPRRRPRRPRRLREQRPPRRRPLRPDPRAPVFTRRPNANRIGCVALRLYNRAFTPNIPSYLVEVKVGSETCTFELLLFPWIVFCATGKVSL